MKGDRLAAHPAKRIAAFATAFFAVNSLTIASSRFDGGLALVWFGSAIAAVMLIGLPRAHWPRAMVALMVASALATSLFGFGPRLAAPLALVNTLEGWLVARLLLALRPERDWLDNVSGLAVFVAVGGVVAPGLAAVAGGFAATYGAPGPWHLHAGQWWAAHALGTLFGFPMVFLASGAGRKDLAVQWTRGRAAELAAHLVLIALVAVLATEQTTLPLLFVPMVPLLLAAFRCGREGAAFGTLVIAAAMILSAHSQSGLIHSLDITASQKTLFLQFYLATLSLLAIPVSVALRQHQLLITELEERKALKRLIADYSDDALLNLDEDGLIRYASPAGERLSGMDELVGERLGVFFDPIDEGPVRDLLVRAAERLGETCVLERPVVRGEEQMWLETKIRAVAHPPTAGKPSSALQGYAVTIRDVTARKKTELDAIEAAETDALTGLPNRRALLDQLERALAHAEQRPFALAIVDLDHFKRINDNHGHLAGDAMLREVAAVMRRMSTPNAYFARLGGEEFAMISRTGGLQSSVDLCEDLRAQIGALAVAGPGRGTLRITASIGVTLINKGSTAGVALTVADSLLYAAKDRGRNQVVSTDNSRVHQIRAA